MEAHQAQGKLALGGRLVSRHRCNVRLHAVVVRVGARLLVSQEIADGDLVPCGVILTAAVTAVAAAAVAAAAVAVAVAAVVVEECTGACGALLGRCRLAFGVISGLGLGRALGRALQLPLWVLWLLLGRALRIPGFFVRLHLRQCGNR